MRRSLPAAAAAALIGGTTVLAFETGGYFDRARLIAGAVAWALVVLAALTAPRPLPTSGPGRVALAGLALLAIWTGLSLLWAPIAEFAEDDLQRVLLYVGAFWAAIVFLRGEGIQRWLEPAIALGVLVVVAYGLSERLVPDLVELDRSFSSSGRLEQPLTYWNAMGILAAVGLLMCIRIAGDPGRPARLRAAAAAAGVPIGLGLYLTFARGALAGLAVGLLVLVALAPAVRSQLRSIVCVVAAAGVASVVANVLPTVKSLPRGQEGDPTEGLVMLAALLALAAAAGAGVLRRPRRRLPSPRLPASRPTTVLSAAAVVVLAGVLAVALLEGTPQGESPRSGADPARFASVDTNRYRYWEVAVGAFADHPVAGLGSSGFAVEWLKEEERDDNAHDAHSLYLETLAELGVVGLALLGLFLGGVVAALVRLHRRDAALATGLSAGLAAWACHAGLDWDWEMPALTLVALLLAGAAIAWSEAPGVSARNLGVRTKKKAVVALGLLLALAMPAPALAQSAGDEQYVDPFQQERGGGGGGNSGSGGDAQQGGGSQGGGDTGTTTAPPTTTDPAVEGATASTPAAGGDGTVLPRTGLPIAGLVATGLLLLAGGFTLRRRA